MDPQLRQIRFYNFNRFKLGGASTLQSRLNFSHCDLAFFFSKLKERLAGRKFSRVRGSLKSCTSFQSSTYYTCFGVGYQCAVQMWLRRLEMYVASGGGYSKCLYCKLSEYPPRIFFQVVEILVEVC